MMRLKRMFFHFQTELFYKTKIVVFDTNTSVGALENMAPLNIFRKEKLDKSTICVRQKVTK